MQSVPATFFDDECSGASKAASRGLFGIVFKAEASVAQIAGVD